jgi:hypothetical protein
MNGVFNPWLLKTGKPFQSFKFPLQIRGTRVNLPYICPRLMKDFPKLSLILILLLCFCIVKMARFDGATGEDWKYQFNTTDSRGYYAYLPDLFIKHDLAHQDPQMPYVNKTEKGNVNKYYIGTPLVWSPFFGAAYAYSKFSGENPDGYGEPFKKAISFAGLFWLFIGLYCLWKILELLEFGEIIISAVLILIVFGTNLLYYATVEPTMAHLYSFSTLAAFLLFLMRYFKTGKGIHLFLAVFFLGLCLLIRPTSLLLVFFLLPFAAGSFQTLKTHFLSRRTWLITLPVLLLFAVLQCGAWYLQTGHWFVHTYVGEGFYLMKPHLFAILLGFKKGWLIYTPLALLALCGMVVIYRQNRFVFFSLLGMFVIHTWLLACWWDWAFADSFGHRAFIDLYPVIAILLAYALRFLPEMNKTVIPFFRQSIIGICLWAGCGFCLYLNGVQTFQYCKHILHYNSMDWEKYKYVFLKTDPRYIGCLGGSNDNPPYSRKTPEVVFTSSTDFSTTLPGWKTVAPEKFKGASCIHFNHLEYASMLEITPDQKIKDAEKLYLTMNLTRYEPEENSSSGTLIVIDVLNKENQHEFYQCFPLNNEPADIADNTRRYTYRVEIPPLKDKDSRMQLYIWNQQKRDFYLLKMDATLERTFP